MARPNLERVSFGKVPWERYDPVLGKTSGFIEPAVTKDLWRSVRYYNGSVTPGWKSFSPRARKKAAPLPHSVNGYKISGHPYSEASDFTRPDGTGYSATYYIENSAVLGSVPSVAHLGEAYTKARADAAAQMNKMHINLAQAFAERRQTANLLVDTAYRIATMARQLRRGDIPGLVDGFSAREADRLRRSVRRQPPSKRIASHWLEVQYGWKPLLQDAYGLATLIASRMSERHHHRVVGYGKAEVVGYVPSNTSGYWTETLTRTTTVCKIGLSFQVDSATRAGLAQTGIDNPALLAWELLPYSFVIDWFVPVGNYLEALNAFSGFTFLEGWQVNRSRKEGVVTYGGSKPLVWNGQYYETGKRRGQYSYHAFNYNRTILNAFPGIGFPSFRNPLGGDPVERLATAASLLRVLFR